MAIQKHPNNIWIAAGDGDLGRVRYLVEHENISPNAPDPFTYTPMHAAASYGQIEILEYLVSHGGDVNITDEDGDTPLYTVENIETATWLIEHGAHTQRVNAEGISPVQHLEEDFPEVAAYVGSTIPSTAASDEPSVAPAQPSQYAEELATDQLTSALMQDVDEIMRRAEAEGRDPEEELRQAVSRTVLSGVVAGYEMNAQAEADAQERGPTDGDAKRQRT